jgi:hypothetical protein
MSRNPDETDRAAAEFAERVRRNQQQLGEDLKPQYDFIVCGSGSSGSVVARRLARAHRLAEPSAHRQMLFAHAVGHRDYPGSCRVSSTGQHSSPRWLVTSICISRR